MPIVINGYEFRDNTPADARQYASCCQACARGQHRSYGYRAADDNPPTRPRDPNTGRFIPTNWETVEENEEETFSCDGCSGEFAEDELHDANDMYPSRRYCERCAPWCDHCDGYYFYEHDENYCEECSSSFCRESDSRCYCDECDESFCDYSCYQRHQDDHHSHGVHNYSYRPTPFNPKGDYRNETLMGIELEVEGNVRALFDAMHSIDETENHFYAKEDSSVRGIEIVTHPFTLAWGRENMPMDTLMSNLRNARASVHPEVGLHVHVSRNAFSLRKGSSAMHAHYWLSWMNGIAANQVDGKLARRGGSGWASFRNDGNKRHLKHKAKGAFYHDRYSAVNCNGDKTFELRFFASTLDPTEFWAAVEFADASVAFTRTLKANDILLAIANEPSKASWAEFARFAKANGYVNLVSEIQKRTTIRPFD